MNAQCKLVGLWLLGLVLFAQTGFCEEAQVAGLGAVTTRRVVVFGDSITAGYGLERSQAFPAVLQRKIEQEKLPFEIVGAGVSGDTTAGGLRRIAWVLGPGAAVCVIALGGNDGLRGIPPEETAANLGGIIRLIRSKCPTAVVILAGMRMPENYGAPYTQAFEALFPKVAAENGTPLVPFLLEGVGGIPEMNQADLIHPTEEGQIKVAENVWKVLHPLLLSLKQGK